MFEAEKWGDVEKPTIGLQPEKFWLEDRNEKIAEAAVRYSDNGKGIPIEWQQEYLRNGLRIREIDNAKPQGER